MASGNRVLIIRKLRNLERMRDAIRILGLILAALLPTWDAAMGDEVRQTEFANPLLGIWAPTIAVCQGREEAKIAISEIRYKSAGSTCGVLWIVESPAAHGINYSVHGLCVGESQPSETDLIIQARSKDQILVGRSFADLKAYYRCPTT